MSKNKCRRGNDDDFSYASLTSSIPSPNKDVPKELIIGENGHGAVFGISSDVYVDIPIGMRQGSEGNIVVIGGPGSGKGVSGAMPTILYWSGPMCITDIKGELLKFYLKYYRKGRDRPPLEFNPIDPNGIIYDPYNSLKHDDEDNLVHNVQEIVSAIIPIKPNERNPFWENAERAVLGASIIHYFKMGLNFSQTMCKIASMSIFKLAKEINENGCEEAKWILGHIKSKKSEMYTDVERGLRDKISVFATDKRILRAFGGEQEGANCFSWKDIEKYKIFIHIPERFVEGWSVPINLMYTQLIRYLQSRPEKYSEEGANIVPTLILMDELASFGKLELLVTGMSTLRSKNVNFCIILQSLPQLEMIYGEKASEIILGNCQYKIIMRADDLTTQKYLSELIGTHKVREESNSYYHDECYDETGSSTQYSMVRENKVFSHELSTMDDIIILSPYGTCRVEKILPNGRIFDKKDVPVLAATIVAEEEEISIPVINAWAISASDIVETDNQE